MELVVFIGLQGSGKSTFWGERFRDSHVRINLDMLKTRHRESLLFDACLVGKAPMVVDNTNPQVADRERYIQPARAAGFRVKGYYFQSKVSECLERNAGRADRVPDLAIRGTHSRLVIPQRSEGFDELWHVRLTGTGFVVSEWRDEL